MYIQTLRLVLWPQNAQKLQLWGLHVCPDQDDTAPRRSGVMKRLKAKRVEVILYEPLLAEDSLFHSEVVRDLDEFKRRSDAIVANRLTADIADVADMVYTRDLFGSD